MTPYEILGVSPKASPKEITEAYRTLAQIFHPDRFVDSPTQVKAEAERRMKNLTQAYALARKGVGGTSMKPATPSTTTTEQAWEAAARERVARAARGVPWQEGVRGRAMAEAKAKEERAARERAATHGKAIARPKSRSDPSAMAGIGEARHTNKILCRDCKSIQWLPEGWEPTLYDTTYFCSICNRLLLSR
ncbi:MAG: J domain-containing protein [Acidimicrobiales bacterium]